MSGGAHVATAAAAAVAGLVVVVRAEVIGAFWSGARVEARRQGGLLNPDRNERVIESFNNPAARRLEVWLLRAVGLGLIVGGAIVLAS